MNAHNKGDQKIEILKFWINSLALRSVWTATHIHLTGFSFCDWKHFWNILLNIGLVKIEQLSFNNQGKVCKRDFLFKTTVFASGYR